MDATILVSLINDLVMLDKLFIQSSFVENNIGELIQDIKTQIKALLDE